MDRIDRVDDLDPSQVDDLLIKLAWEQWRETRAWYSEHWPDAPPAGFISDELGYGPRPPRDTGPCPQCGINRRFPHCENCDPLAPLWGRRWGYSIADVFRNLATINQQNRSMYDAHHDHEVESKSGPFRCPRCDGDSEYSYCPTCCTELLGTWQDNGTWEAPDVLHPHDPIDWYKPDGGRRELARTPKGAIKKARPVTKLQRQVAAGIMRGETDAEIARRVGASERGVGKARARLLADPNTETSKELARARATSSRYRTRPQKRLLAEAGVLQGNKTISEVCEETEPKTTKGSQREQQVAEGRHLFLVPRGSARRTD